MTDLQIINGTVLQVRDELASEHDVTADGDYKDFAGLCDESVSRFIYKMIEFAKNNNIKMEYSIMHGEQSHTPICPSKYWPRQHTWCSVNMHGCTKYVDPTSSQFRDIYPDIPDYYVSYHMPKWYYNDRKNPRWNGITRKIEDRIWIMRKVIFPDGHQIYVKDGIVSIIQYELWGRISDLIRRCIYRW